MKLAICIPYRDHQSGRAAAAIMASVIQAQRWLSKVPNMNLEIELITKYRAHVHVARHDIAQRALAAKADVLLWFDDDAVPPINLIPCLWNHLMQYDIVVPFFVSRAGGSVTYLLEREVIDGKGAVKKLRLVTETDPPQVIGMSGFHTVLMKATALQACYDASGGNPFRMTQELSEDHCFFQIAFLAGLKAYCDTTVRVGHLAECIYGGESTPASPERSSP